MKPLDREALRAACYEVARAIRWEKNPVDAVLASAMVEPYYQEAMHHEQFLTEQGYDPNGLTRAVKYLALKHTIPPMAEDIVWFREMLHVLIELACPNQSVDRETDEFFAISRPVSQLRAIMITNNTFARTGTSFGLVDSGC